MCYWDKLISVSYHFLSPGISGRIQTLNIYQCSTNVLLGQTEFFAIFSPLALGVGHKLLIL